MKKLGVALSVILFVFVVTCTLAQETSQFNRSHPYHHEDAVIDNLNEAPMLAERVARGELPPVVERLPSNPVVVAVRDSIGTYGGTWRSAYPNFALWWIMAHHMNYADLVRQVQGYSGNFEADLAERWEVSDDNRVWTFYLREGLKWSDGQPFTTEDIMFWYEDVLQNPDLTPSIPAFLRIGGELGRFEALDDQTLQISFSQPYGMFMLNLTGATWYGFAWVHHPKHYMSQFHPNHVPEEELNARVRQAGLDSWADLYNREWHPHLGGTKPWMFPWVPQGAAAEDGRMTWVRNPYYYKVDEEGNQLPYIDYVSWEMLADAEVILLNTLAGRYHWYTVALRSPHFAALRDAEARGAPIRVIPSINAKMGEISLFINQTTEDPVMREIFQDVRFRQAVSLAIDRDEIVNASFFGLAEGRQAAYPPQDPFVYNEEWANAFTEYDPDEANRLLDEIGLGQRDAQGYRLRPDGQRLTITFDTVSTKHQAAMELMVSHLQDVGLEVRNRPAPDALSYERTSSNTVQWSSHSMQPSFFNPIQLMPLIPTRAWAIEWDRWLTSNGTEGKEPPADFLRLNEVVTGAIQANTIEERIALLTEAGNLHKDNLWVIGIVGMEIRPIVVHTSLQNATDDPAPPYGINHDPGAHINYPEQFYLTGE